MEIVCLIRSNPPLIYFVNAINEKHPVSLVIVENPELHEEQDTVEDSDTGFWRKCQRFGIRGLLASFMKKILSSIEKQKNTGIRAQHYLEDRTDEFNEILDRIFGDKWKKIDDQIERVDVPNINVNEVQEMIAAKKGCIVLDHGTSLVKANTIKFAKHALNLHWGLSPYYRGTHCTEWAIVNRDPFNIGVTIHSLSNNIDGGKIWAQKRVCVEENDIVYSINMKLTKNGTDLIINILNKLKNGEKVFVTAQDLTQGMLTWIKQYSTWLDIHVREMELDGFGNNLLKKPSRSVKMPIITLD